MLSPPQTAVMLQSEHQGRSPEGCEKFSTCEKDRLKMLLGGLLGDLLVLMLMLMVKVTPQGLLEQPSMQKNSWNTDE